MVGNGAPLLGHCSELIGSEVTLWGEVRAMDYVKALQGQYDSYAKSGSMKLSHSQLMSVAEDLNHLRWMLNAHDGALAAQDGAYGAVEGALRELLRNRFGDHADELLWVIGETSETVKFALKNIRRRDHEYVGDSRRYVVTVNQPGYLPNDDGEPAIFETAHDAWGYFVDVFERDWSAESEAAESDEEREAVDARFLPAHTEIHGGFGLNGILGSVHVDGPTDTHLGYVYSVSEYME